MKNSFSARIFARRSPMMLFISPRLFACFVLSRRDAKSTGGFAMRIGKEFQITKDCDFNSKKEYGKDKV